MRVILPFFTEKRPSPLSPLTAPLTRNRHRNGSEQSPLALPQAALPEARPAPSFTPAMLLPTTIVLFLNVGNAASAAVARPRIAPRVSTVTGVRVRMTRDSRPTHRFAW